ncbi:hypothetical protein F4779DRAFT_577523 [Xylariaceae sp. FL0662B]|nr:hypothetical protein F4779DRAFT_577523 [Xylariaceae sp. FL0662B]
MRCQVTTLFAGLLLATGVRAGDNAVLEEMRRDFIMGLFPRQEGEETQSPLNLQPFNESLGGIPPPPIEKGDNPERPFFVQGASQSDDLDTFANAGNKACDFQFDECQKKANDQHEFEVSECDEQNSKCKDAVNAATVTTFRDPTTTQGDFVIFC